MDDTSLRSVQPLPELSLGSLNSSSFASDLDSDDARALPSSVAVRNFNNRLLKPSIGASTTGATGSGSATASVSSPTTAASSAPLMTPSPPSKKAALTGKAKAIDPTPLPIRRVESSSADEGDETALETPIRERPSILKTSKPLTPQAKPPTNLTLREQEKTIDQLNKQIWGLQLKIHYLEERLDQTQPATHQTLARQNVALKVEVHTLETELKKCKKLVLRLEKELASAGASVEKEKELTKKLLERDAELRELRKKRGSYMDPDASGIALQEAEDRLADLEDHAVQLENELDDTRRILDAKEAENEDLKDVIARGPSGGKLVALEDENTELRERLADFEDELARRDDEREALLDELESVKLTMEEMERRREAEAQERSVSRAEIYEREEEREVMESEINTLRDKLSRAHLDLEMREEDLDQREREMEDIVEQVREKEELWKGEFEEVEAKNEELRAMVEEKDSELQLIGERIAEYESQMQRTEEEFDANIRAAHENMRQKEAELEATNLELQRLGDRIFELEDEAERYHEETEKWKDEALNETAKLEQTVAVLKEKHNNAKAQVESAHSELEKQQRLMLDHRKRQEELAAHIQELLDEIADQKETHQRLQQEYTTAVQTHEDEMRKQRREFDAKDSALQSALGDLTRKEAEVRRVQGTYEELKKAHLDAQSRGNEKTGERYSLQLEIDRLTRDVQRLEDDLRRARKDLEDREGKIRERDGTLDQLYVEVRELKSAVAAQTQARLNIAEKLDGAQSSVKSLENELSVAKHRLAESEAELSRAQRGVIGTENQYRDQVTERNTLLLTIYQYIEKTIGVDKFGNKVGSSAEVKPFTNFPVFHDNLISRLKMLSKVQTDFEKRVREVETRYTEKLEGIRRQLDQRWKQLDKFEISVGKIADQKVTWRRKYQEKDGELESIRTAHADAMAQLSILRRAPQTDTSGLKAMTARAVNAEKRLTNVQNQLLSTEEKLHQAKDKTGSSEMKWEARVKEYETRLKAAEERVKRERQGAKERVQELEGLNRSLAKDLEAINRRIGSDGAEARTPRAKMTTPIDS